MKLFKSLLILFFVVSRALAQTNTNMPNIGFEDGTFDYWQCYIGHIDLAGVVNVTPSAPIFDRQTLYGNESAGVVDPYGKFPVLCPNGSNYSMRLGNKDTSAEAERVTYTFTVPHDRAYSIIFNYAVVLEDPPHLPYQQPKFTAQVYDVTDSKYIDCPSFDFVASSDLPGFKLSTVEGARGASIYYKDWSTATIDLRGYLGKVIRLEFTTNDCTLGGHFGYAYLDIDENVGSPISGNTYCAGQKSITLFAPNGFDQYYWFTGDLSKQIGSGQSLTISPPPPDLTSYAVKILPYPLLGCVDTIYTVVNKIDTNFKLKVLDTIYGCPSTGVNLTAAAVTAGSSPGIMLSYFRDSLVTSYLYNPSVVDTSGVYYIQGVNKEGCMSVLPVEVIIAKPVINVTDPKAVTFPVTVDLSTTFIPQKGLTYSYYSNASATVPVENYTAIQYGGTFYIKAVNKVGCTSIVPVNVIIYPPPPYVITAPNTFTPNNDGINDYFTVTVKGVVTFETVRIFNRSGQLIYLTKSPNDNWNGNYNGQALPVGTYYWVFEGIDDYYKKRINQAGSITLLR
jgi:gliding motility-associated-like protein